MMMELLLVVVSVAGGSVVLSGLWFLSSRCRRSLVVVGGSVDDVGVVGC